MFVECCVCCVLCLLSVVLRFCHLASWQTCRRSFILKLFFPRTQEADCECQWLWSLIVIIPQRYTQFSPIFCFCVINLAMYSLLYPHKSRRSASHLCYKYFTMSYRSISDIFASMSTYVLSDLFTSVTLPHFAFLPSHVQTRILGSFTRLNVIREI